MQQNPPKPPARPPESQRDTPTTERETQLGPIDQSDCAQRFVQEPQIGVDGRRAQFMIASAERTAASSRGGRGANTAVSFNDTDWQGATRPHPSPTLPVMHGLVGL